MQHQPQNLTRPKVYEIRNGFTGQVSYGVEVRFGREVVFVESFATGADAWAKGVDVLADLIERAQASELAEAA